MNIHNQYIHYYQYPIYGCLYLLQQNKAHHQLSQMLLQGCLLHREHPVPHLDVFHVGPHGGDDPGELVPQNDGRFGAGVGALEGVQIGAADPGVSNFDFYQVAGGFRLRYILIDHIIIARSCLYHCFHTDDLPLRIFVNHLAICVTFVQILEFLAVMTLLFFPEDVNKKCIS